MNLRSRFTLIIIAAVAMAASAADTDSVKQEFSYVPTVGGVVRARWEMLTDDGSNRFAVSNARLKVSGMIAPTIDYFLQSDFCANGKLMFLDGWGRIAILPQLKIRAGRFRIPFGVDTFRYPGNYIFGNRSFIGKYVDNIRAVGFDISYTLPGVPLKLEAGVFNQHGENHSYAWSHHKQVAVKAAYTAAQFTFTAGYQNIRPGEMPINMVDAAVTFNSGRWLAEAEYMYSHYTCNSFTDNHAYNVYVSYDIPVKIGPFRTLSVQSRFDGMNDFSTGIADESGNLVCNQAARDRLTLGATLVYTYKGMRCNLRVNYENYFYRKNKPAADSDARNRLLAEIAVMF